MTARKKKHCCECERQLEKDEIALSQKLLGRDADEYYCIDCLAEYLECTQEALKTKIQEFKEQGCTLFL
jgi:biotin operon repressor